jgi:nucleoid-associated protein YgaU
VNRVGELLGWALDQECWKMTKEAKIGLVVGLGVILLIGVLLSNYLGEASTSAPAKMAELPIGASYRNRVMGETGVPGGQGAGQGAAGVQPPVQGGNQPTNLVLGYAAVNVPASERSQTGGEGAVVTGAVTPQADGRVAISVLPPGEVPTFQGSDSRSGSGVVGSGGTGASNNVAAVKPVSGEEYVIAPGDTLTKIAKKEYKSAKAEDLQRIVAANPGMLKDVKTMLVAGKKLLIPEMLKATVPVAGAGVSGAAIPATKVGSGQVSGGGPAAGATRWYMVASGDTLEKIARKLGAKDTAGFVKQVSALNKIRDPRGLKVGMKLRVP